MTRNLFKPTGSKNRTIFFSISFLILLGYGSPAQMIFTDEQWETTREDTSLTNKFLRLKNVERVEPMNYEGDFLGKYKLLVRQPLDPQDPQKGSFLQSVIINHKGFSKPTIVITEGYDAKYALFPAYENELTNMTNGNQICIEHRYFGESRPEKMDWQYLTVENAASDHHSIIGMMKDLYTGKWISTGISKGGQTALYHRTLYPEDVDITVAYVNPLNFDVEDGRHEPFIENNGKEEERNAVRTFQLEVLSRRDSIFPLFQEFVESNDYTFRIPGEEVYDYCVLEYSFAYWQWRPEVFNIPGKGSTTRELFDHFISISSPDYFAEQSMWRFQPFFVQAANQLGYYGYDTSPFDSLLVIDDAEGYLYRIFMPDSVCFPFDISINEKVVKFLEREDPKVIFIYGEYDPWTASAVEFSGKKNMKKYINPEGNHGTRISNMPIQKKSEILKTLDEWLDE